MNTRALLYKARPQKTSHNLPHQDTPTARQKPPLPSEKSGSLALKFTIVYLRHLYCVRDRVHWHPRDTDD